jgi:hypothetical protein
MPIPRPANNALFCIYEFDTPTGHEAASYHAGCGDTATAYCSGTLRLDLNSPTCNLAHVVAELTAYATLHGFTSDDLHGSITYDDGDFHIIGDLLDGNLTRQ